MKNYHPDDCPNLYLNDDQVTYIANKINKSIVHDYDIDAITLIAQHEEIHKNFALGQISKNEYQEVLEKLAQDYLNKYSDWVHNKSKAYWEFYNTISTEKIRPHSV